MHLPHLQCLGQFFPHGNLPKAMAPVPEETSAEFPFTLDLRCQRKR